MPLAPNSAVLAYQAQQGGIPKLELPDKRVVETPCREWLLHNVRWRWLLDSYEGGEAYRTASYGTDLRGFPVRNLIRHKREYPMPQDGGAYPPNVGRPPGTDQAAQATDDDYEMRRARTPIPTFTSEAISEHLSKIYNQEIRREGPQALVDWWADVDGSGQSIDQWMAESFAPLLMAFGQLDVLVDNPPRPDGEAVDTRADEIRLGLDKCVVSYILPMNVPWWRVDRRGRYTELVMREVDDEGGCRYRYWNDRLWVLYDGEGEEIERRDHPHKVVPIVRLFDKKRPSCRHVGLPPYETIAEIQREYYNRDSELILSDTTQAHPLTMVPEDLIKGDSSVGVGPGWGFPMKWREGGYHGAQILDYPKGAADSLRTNKNDLRDTADRAACLTKPAGAAGTTGQTVGQSGVSKRLDQSTGNELLGKRAAVLQRAEQVIASMACVVLGVVPATDPEAEDAVKVAYPRQFDLWNADELMTAIQNFELALSQVGDAPETEHALLSKAVRLMLPGCDDDEYEEMDAEIEDLLERRQKEKKQQREAALDATTTEQADETDPAATDATDDPLNDE